MIEVTRYHDVCFGHRVYGHENKCANLHRHNYRFHFTIRAKDGLDNIGRVIDFSQIKSILCEWLEKNWDHKMLLWTSDPLGVLLDNLNHAASYEYDYLSVLSVPFNPTAENIAKHFLEVVAPQLLEGADVFLYSVKVEETRKCSATATLDSNLEAKESMPDILKPKFEYPKGMVCYAAECKCREAGKLEEHCTNLGEDLPF